MSSWEGFTDDDLRVEAMEGSRRQTSCRKAGHDWKDPRNVRVRKSDGARYCAECIRQSSRQKYRERTGGLTRRPPGAAIKRDADGNKECLGCGQWLPVDRFASNARRTDGLNPRCVPCYTDYQRAYAHGITSEEWQRIFARQGGVCAICGASDPGQGAKAWATDHDHACCPNHKRGCGRCVRGILCYLCNTGLGYFNDDPAALRAAVAYLEEWKNGRA